MKKSFLIVFLILIIDQAVKIWVKTNMTIGQEFHIMGDWFIIHFTENPGMAFGFEFGMDYGKLLLSLFRIVAIIALIYYIYYSIRRKAHEGLIISLSLVLAGAIGNVIDSAFYGLIFSNSNYMEVARLFPPEGGYATFLHGKVVDMFYFPILHGTYPPWFPFLGGEEFIFFRPVFNVADSSITIGVFLLLIFQKRFFGTEEAKSTTGQTETEIIDTFETTE